MLSGLEVMLISIYAPHNVECKRQLWNNLLQLTVSFLGVSISWEVF